MYTFSSYLAEPESAALMDTYNNYALALPLSLSLPAVQQ